MAEATRGLLRGREQLSGTAKVATHRSPPRCSCPVPPANLHGEPGTPTGALPGPLLALVTASGLGRGARALRTIAVRKVARARARVAGAALTAGTCAFRVHAGAGAGDHIARPLAALYGDGTGGASSNANRWTKGQAETPPIHASSPPHWDSRVVRARPRQSNASALRVSCESMRHASYSTG